MSAADDVEGAKLFVLGKTRVGKGEFIKTAVYELTGQELDITSNRLDSHTRHSTGYAITLGGKPVDLTDTVGFDDSSCEDLSETAFLELLAETGSSPYYPPLVILQALSGSDLTWLKKIVSVFPSITCAVRCKTSDFQAAQTSLAELLQFNRVQLFHLSEFADEQDDGGYTQRTYKNQVVQICKFYAAMNPTRGRLDFDKRIFQGEVMRVKIKTENKTEDTIVDELYTRQEDVIVKTSSIVTLDDGGHYEDVEVEKRVVERFVDGVKKIYHLGLAAWSKIKTVKEWVKDTKECVVEESSIEKRNLDFIERTTTRSYYQRDLYEVWKVLAGGMKIFMNYEEGEWQKIHEEVINVTRKRVSTH